MRNRALGSDFVSLPDHASTTAVREAASDALLKEFDPWLT